MPKRYRKRDPHSERESEKYEHPVPSREFIMEFFEEHPKPQTLQQLIQAFSLKSEEEDEGLRRRLRAMERDGQLMSNRRGAYGLVNKMDLIPGRVIGHKDGFGFVVPDDGKGDIFLPARQMRGIFSDDRVLIRVTGEDHRKRREGIVVQVLERNTHQVVGRYLEEGGVTFVDPDDKAINQDIIIPPGKSGDATPGQLVVAKIIVQPTKRRQPAGEIVEILGDTITPGMEVELALRSHEIPFVFPESVLTEADELPDHVTDRDLQGRQDLRDLPFVTIDGEDARDFDDAIYCEPHDGGWRLFVAIADVTHYVAPGSELDTEAITRGTSVYFPSRVIPMLPEALSNELCSLKPKVDRLAMVCEMQIKKNGDLSDYEFYPAVIHSHARLTYTYVADLLKQKGKKKDLLYPHIHCFYQLYRALLNQRDARGAIDFDSVETQILFDENGKIDKIVPRHRNEAHRMIEEAMLLANVSTADFLEKAGIHVLYRVHEGPDEAKLLALRDFLKPFGLRLTGGDDPKASDYSKLLKRVAKRADAPLLQTVMLRSMRQATYTPENRGHFGLAYEHYTHFTSPIRRYPDVLVHRAVKHLIAGNAPKDFVYDLRMMEEFGEHASTTERRADLATRDATDWLKCEYMLDKVGEEFDGKISDVCGFGVFVELKDIYVHGLVHVTALKNDYYHYDATHHLMRGKQSGNTYRLGDPIRIMVARVDLDKREIDFDLA